MLMTRCTGNAFVCCFRTFKGRCKSLGNRLSAKSFSSSANHQRYEDDAFVWARKHPNDARTYLGVPPLNSDQSSTFSSFQTLEDYLKWRSWKLPANNPLQEEYAKRLVSHVLSAPLTLANHSSGFENVQRWCCVGARAEATLPPDYWREFLVAVGPSKRRDFSLEFVGLDFPKLPESTISVPDRRSIHLEWHRPGYLHEMGDPPDCGAFVLFNPGLGHANLVQGWRPTLEWLKTKDKPLLLTAHSRMDAERDAKILQEHYPDLKLEYQPNPFASRISYEDPFSKGHLVQPNQYVLLIPSNNNAPS